MRHREEVIEKRHAEGVKCHCDSYKNATCDLLARNPYIYFVIFFRDSSEEPG